VIVADRRLLRDKIRWPGKAPTPEDSVRRVVTLTCGEPPGRGNPLDRPGDGHGDRALLAHRAADLGRTLVAAVPHPHLQTLP
jgi:hypothetical protein